VLTELAGEAIATDAAADWVPAYDDLARLAGVPDCQVVKFLLAGHVHAVTAVVTRVLLRAHRNHCTRRQYSRLYYFSHYKQISTTTRVVSYSPTAFKIYHPKLTCLARLTTSQRHAICRALRIWLLLCSHSMARPYYAPCPSVYLYVYRLLHTGSYY